MPINFSNVFYVYNPKSPFQYEALKNVNLTIEEGGFVALVGRTGSGKSTLISHLNALLHPTAGQVVIDDFVNSAEKKKRSRDIKALRQKVGLVFQFPEYQLFEETVEKDVAFGPKNFGATNEEALKQAHEALGVVGLDPTFYERSPFELSGGEKRKVAIAGILAIHPKILIVDEPTAGLDPRAAEETMTLFQKIHEEGTTIILVTHDMNLVLHYAEEVIVMENGQVALQCHPSELFGKDLAQYSLEVPDIYRFARDLQGFGLKIDTANLHSIPDLALAIKGAYHHE